jgi:hypothetical protein
MPLIPFTHLEVPRKPARREDYAATGLYAKGFAVLVEHRADSLAALEHQLFNAGVEPYGHIALFQRKQEPAHQRVSSAKLGVPPPALTLEVAQHVQEHLPSHEHHGLETDPDRSLSLLRGDPELA